MLAFLLGSLAPIGHHDEIRVILVVIPVFWDVQGGGFIQIEDRATRDEGGAGSVITV